MRHGWRSSWSGVRTPVRLSVQGRASEVPATAPFSIPLHHRYRRWMGGVSPPSFSQPPAPDPAPDTHKNEAPGTAHLQQRAPSLVPPAARWRMSSSYSSSACLRKRTRTLVFRVEAGCTAAAPRCQNPCLTPFSLSLSPSPVLNVSVCVWRGGGTQHTINLGYGNGGARAPPRAVFVVCCAVQN